MSSATYCPPTINQVCIIAPGSRLQQYAQLIKSDLLDLKKEETNEGRGCVLIKDAIHIYSEGTSSQGFRRAKRLGYNYIVMIAREDVLNKQQVLSKIKTYYNNDSKCREIADQKRFVFYNLLGYVYLYSYRPKYKTYLPWRMDWLYHRWQIVNELSSSQEENSHGFMIGLLL